MRIVERGKRIDRALDTPLFGLCLDGTPLQVGGEQFLDVSGKIANLGPAALNQV